MPFSSNPQIRGDVRAQTAEQDCAIQPRETLPEQHCREQQSRRHHHGDVETYQSRVHLERLHQRGCSEDQAEIEVVRADDVTH